MATTAATGASAKDDTRKATEEAVGQAMSALRKHVDDNNDNKPLFGLIFASPRHSLGTALEVACAATGCQDIVGASTAGELTERGPTKGGVSVMLIASDAIVHDVAVAQGITTAPERAAQTLSAGFGEAEQSARARGLAHSTTLLLSDGLSSGFEKVVADLRRHTRPFQPIVGGGAGDDGALKSTTVGLHGIARSDTAAVAHVFTSKPWGIGVEHGLFPATEKMTVTRSNGNIVEQIDGTPAFEVYEAFARTRGVELTRDNAPPFLIQHELGMILPNQTFHARAAIALGENGALVCAGAVPTGSPVCILEGRPDAMIDAARQAARSAKDNLVGVPAAGVLVFSCICRGMLLGDRYGEEVDAVRSSFPNVPIAGLLSYGEIARFKGKLDGYHNNTIVVAAIPS